ncbi:GntR family transcriptional regulator [Conexibacter arvalis]|uniref:GntR family transcriptional regulator n=1 Tax=Conexibacter arvalis TaxID=912552 RepID=UPI001C842D5F
MLAFDRVDRPSLADMAHASISRSILAGEVPPGTQLKETHLADQLGMSRAPIREAFKRLADEHLVVERPRYGVFVREFDADDIADIYNLRVAIETTAARLFIRAGASTTPLRALVDEMEAAAGRGDTEAVVDAEVRFHQTLCDLCGNGYVSAVFRNLQGPIHMAMGMDDRNYVDLDEIVHEHDPVVDALEGGDEQVAVAVIAEHITSSVASVIERLGGDPGRILD